MFIDGAFDGHGAGGLGIWLTGLGEVDGETFAVTGAWLDGAVEGDAFEECVALIGVFTEFEGAVVDDDDGDLGGLEGGGR